MIGKGTHAEQCYNIVHIHELNGNNRLQNEIWQIKGEINKILFPEHDLLYKHTFFFLESAVPTSLLCEN